MWVSPFGYHRIDGYLLLPGAFRSLSRPSSALSAKASTLRSFCLTFFKSRFSDIALSDQRSYDLSAEVICSASAFASAVIGSSDVLYPISLRFV